HPLTLELLRLAGVPFAAPSANRSGAPSPRTAGEVLASFDGQIAAVVDGGPCDLGRESTLLDMSAAPYRILRQGALPAEEIADALADGMEVVGIAGGSGSGKTTALRALERRGALTIDCDAVYHELLATDAALLDEIGARFPGTVRQGALDRKALGAIVFRSDADLRDLDAIAHRAIAAEVRRRLRGHAMAGGTLAAIDASELFESPLAERCDWTIGVTADEETRIARIVARDGISRDYARLRVRAQRPDRYLRERCDVVLANDGDEATFISHIDKILEERLHHG
ncbi:MAG: dephospho-CoA kinase, partial [Oscillospiraceae bacterium]|nr:dephospho-CoA kinase [Oscillospiraceae bacterium]